ncbi:MAG: methylenetetrahydrofolate reductase [Actinomycetota bacterium]|nr:MAG: methylenetetrahydrofolate reductase [Actinomycetota bacterium]
MRTSEPRPRALEGLSAEERAAVRRVVAAARFELIPLPSALERAEGLPPGAPVTVTASPGRGIEATLELAAELARRGHPATPHLSARLVRDRAHLGEVLDRCRETGLREAFVVGGDGDGPSAFVDGLALLRAIHELGSPFERIGVPGYPEGHPEIPRAALEHALLAKAPLADWISTQMCFDPAALEVWIAGVRAAGVGLAIHLGVPGVVEVAKLLTIGARIGLASSARYLRKNRSLLGRIARGRFGPDGILEALAGTIADPAAGVTALHVFTFNQVGPTVGWQRALLETLRA